MNLIIFVALYVVSVAYLTFRNFQYPICGDREGEYNVFGSMIGENVCVEEILKYCPLVTAPPYILWRLFKVPAFTAFRITPAFFHALLPAFMFLIAREWFDVGYSLLAVFLVISNFFFMCYTDTGRMGIAIGLLAGALWGIVTGNVLVSIFFLALLLLAHYGTAQYTLFVLGASWLTGLLTSGSSLTITYAVYISMLWFWQNILCKVVGKMSASFLESAVRSDLITPSLSGKQGFLAPRVAWLSFDGRDPMLKSAFGFTWNSMKLPQKLELITSWLITIMVSASVVYAMRQGVTVPSLLGLWAFVAIVIAVVVPYISRYYGVIRTYTTSMLFLTPLVIRLIADYQLGWIVLGILIVHSLLVAGVPHYLWGLDKYKAARLHVANRYGEVS